MMSVRCRPSICSVSLVDLPPKCGSGVPRIRAHHLKRLIAQTTRERARLKPDANTFSSKAPI